MPRLCPAKPAATAPGKVKRGHDRRLWVSTRLENGSYRWQRKSQQSKCTAKKRRENNSQCCSPKVRCKAKHPECCPKHKTKKPRLTKSTYSFKDADDMQVTYTVTDDKEMQTFCDLLEQHKINEVYDENGKNVTMMLLAQCNQRPGLRGVRPGRRRGRKRTVENGIVQSDKKMQRLS